MKAFAALYAALDASTATLDKVAALRQYFQTADAADAAWAVYFLAGGKPRRTVPTALLRATACREAGLPDWLFEECYQAVGDLAETIAHVLPPADAPQSLGLAAWVEQRLLPLRGQPSETQADALAAWWRELDAPGRFLLTKLIGGGFRVGVSKLLVQRALAEAFGVDAKVVAQRMMGYTDAQTLPTAARFQALYAAQAEADAGQPYPFFLAHALAGEVQQLGRARRLAGGMEVRRHPRPAGAAPGPQLGLVARRGADDRSLPRGGGAVAARLPDGCVLDGEILVWIDGAPAPFQRLQQRIGRKTLTKKLLAEAPVTFLAYDLLEWQGQDQRALPLRQRRARLEALCADTGLAAVAARGGRQLARAGRAARAGARTRRRRPDAQGAGLGLRQRPHQGRRHLVEVEGRPAQRRLRAHLCAGRPWPPRQRLHRLQLRGVEPAAARCRRSRRRGRGHRTARAGAYRARCSWWPLPRPTRA